MKLFLSIGLLAFLSLSHAFAGDLDAEGSSLLGSKALPKTYGFHLYHPNAFHSLVRSVGIKSPIYKILPHVSHDERPFLQDMAQKFTKPEIYDRKAVETFFNAKKFNVVLGKNEVVIGQAKHTVLLAFVSDPIFIGTIEGKNNRLKFTDLPKHEKDQEAMKAAYNAASDVFFDFDITVYQGQSEYSQINSVFEDDDCYEDMR